MRQVLCPHCSARYRVADKLVTGSVVCGKCGNVFAVEPKGSADEAPQAAAGPRPAGRAAAPPLRFGMRRAGGPAPIRGAESHEKPKPGGRLAGGVHRGPAGVEGSDARERRAPYGRHHGPGRSPVEPPHANGAHGHVRGQHAHHGARPKPLFARYPAVLVVCAVVLLCLGGLLTLAFRGGGGGETQQVRETAVSKPAPAPPPVIHTVQPDRMADEDVLKGSNVTVFGENWKPGLQVLFGANPSPSVRIDGIGAEGKSDRVEAQVPRGIGEVQLKVRNADGQESNGVSFTYKGEWELWFNPDTDLPEYLNVSRADYAKWIVDLEPFKARAGQKITNKEREKIRESWSQVWKTYQSDAEAIRTDPRLQEAYRVAERLHTQHNYFKKVDFSVVKQLPFVYFIQRPPKDDPKYKAEIVAKFGPFLESLRHVFEEEYVKPLRLKPQLKSEIYCMAILATRGNYAEDFASAAGLGRGGLRLSAAHYDPEWRFAVTYEDEFTPLSHDQERRNAILHEFVHALQHMYSSGEMPKPVWYNEGLAEFLAAGGPEDVKDLSRRPFPEQHLLRFMAAMDQGGKLFVNSVLDLVTADGPGYLEVIRRAAARAGGGVPVNSEEFVGRSLDAFYAQSTLMVYFLHEGAGGKHRQGFLEYMQAVQAGESGLPTFSKAFPGVDPQQLQSGFLDFVRERGAK